MQRLIFFRYQQCGFLSSSTVERCYNTASTLVVSNHFPDASASAAGVRTQSLLEGLANSSQNVHLATAVSGGKYNRRSSSGEATVSQVTGRSSTPVAATAPDIIDELARRNISWSWLPPNRSQRMQDFFRQYPHFDTILLDRFYTEEAYSFAMKNNYPDAALILDMQDMHSLRGGRETVVRDWDAKYNQQNDHDPLNVLESVMAHIPAVDNPQLLRELGSIHRCDLTLVCSPYELQLLEHVYGISSGKLSLAPFFVPTETIRPMTSEIRHSQNDAHSFVFCGGFKHAPNIDAVRLLLRTIWPQIRAQLPTAQLHIHGAYCPMEFQQAHNPVETGIHVHGYTPSLETVWDRPGSVLLAPLRFGAGIKGKIIDAWTYGMPVVTTPVGAEGMTTMARKGDEKSFGGDIAWTIEDFVELAVQLVVTTKQYVDAAQRGQELLCEMQNRETNWTRVASAIDQVRVDLHQRRSVDYTRALLWHHSNRSTEYFSRWIELKETSTEKEKNAR